MWYYDIVPMYWGMVAVIPVRGYLQIREGIASLAKYARSQRHENATLRKSYMFHKISLK